jgi:rSAM/selenodomain-associated transferase 1
VAKLWKKLRFSLLLWAVNPCWLRVYRFPPDFGNPPHIQVVMDKELKKALLVFARRPVAGMVKTRLVPPLSPEEAAELYCCMLGDTLAKVVSLPDVAKFLFYEEGEGAREYFAQCARGMTCIPQQGKDLGERMAEAFRAVFAAGYDAAAIIGSDSPDLPLSLLEEAFARMAEDGTDTLFGPSEDGGYYLLAMRELHGELFRNIAWSSGSVLQKSLENAGKAGVRVSLLPTWHDVDTAEDLRRPELLDVGNGAPLTREFILNRH